MEIHDQMVRSQGAFPQTVKGLKNVLASPLYVMTNTTMLRTNVHTIPATLDFLADLGVPTIGLNALIYSGRGATGGNGAVGIRAVAGAGAGPPEDRNARPAPDLVYADPVLCL